MALIHEDLPFEAPRGVHVPGSRPRPRGDRDQVRSFAGRRGKPGPDVDDRGIVCAELMAPVALEAGNDAAVRRSVLGGRPGRNEPSPGNGTACSQSLSQCQSTSVNMELHGINCSCTAMLAG